MTASVQSGCDEEQEVGLLYELSPGWAEGWVRVSIARSAAGCRIVIEGHNYCYRLTPTPLVLHGILERLRAIAGETESCAKIGAAGRQVLAKLPRYIDDAA